MKNSFLILLILTLGCGYKPLNKSDTESLNSLKSKSIIDLTNAVNFSKDDSLIIIDSSFLADVSNLLRISSKNIKVIYLAKDEDRMYLTSFQYRAERVLDYFIDKGGDKERLVAEIGLDYQSKYPELKNSSIVLLVN